MQIFIIFIVMFFLFNRKNGVEPPKQFSSGSDVNDSNSITVDSASLSSTAPKPIKNQDGTVTIKATITPAKAKAISQKFIEEFAEWTTEEADVMAICMEMKNDADYALVYDAFGMKGKGFLTQALDVGVLAVGQTDLTGWILNQVEETVNLNKLKQRFPTIF